MDYLNVFETGTRLLMLTVMYPDICNLIPSAFPTYEGRWSPAVHVANPSLSNADASDRPGILFIGGVHAREWGSSDILINFLDILLDAYHNNTGISFGGTTFSADQVQNLINNFDIFVFPTVNPDGKHYSQSDDGEIDWRKNRAPTIPATCVQILQAPTIHYPGVDINRNYDFLWDFHGYIDPSPNAVFGVSDNPCAETYHGVGGPFSDSETRNVKWFFDTYPNIKYFIDIHSSHSKDLIIYPWGHDENQNDDEHKTFLNPNYLGQWGNSGDNLKQYINREDERVMREWFCVKMKEAIKGVRGKSYQILTGFGLYGTTGTSLDYAYSRHLSDPTKRKVYSFTIEWGEGWWPDYDTVMVHIITDISAALTQFCISAYQHWKRIAFHRMYRDELRNRI